MTAPLIRRCRLGALLAGLLVVIGACGAQPQPPSLPLPAPAPAPVVTAPPPDPSPFEIGDDAFSAGDFAAASNAYRRGLALADEGNPLDRERALLRLSYMHALPESSIRDLEQADRFLDQLLTEYPRSSEAEGVRSLLNLQSTVQFLEDRIAGLQDAISELQSATLALEADRSEQSEVIGKLMIELNHLDQQLAATEAELARIKAIDLGRRQVN